MKSSTVRPRCSAALRRRRSAWSSDAGGAAIRSSPTRPRWLLRWSAASSRTGTPRFTPKRRCTVASQYDNISAKPEPRTTAKQRADRDGMGGGTSWGLGRRDTAATSKLLSTQSRPSPTDRGRGDNPGHEGTASRRGYSLRSACGRRTGEPFGLTIGDEPAFDRSFGDGPQGGPNQRPEEQRTGADH